MTNCSETPFNLFSFTLLSKNASANHLESHSCKNKGLKVPCFHTLTKKGVGEGGVRVSKPEMVVLLALRHEGSEHRESKDPSESSKPFRLIHFRKNASANPLASTLTGFTLVKSFTSNTYEKHTGGEGVHLLSTLDCQLTGFLYLINLLYPPFPPAYASSLSAVSISERAWSSPFFLATAIPLERISRASLVRASFASNWPKWK